MSRNEWERGEIKFSTKEFTPFRHAVVRTYNEHQTQLYNLATEFYGRLKAAGKGKRGFNFHTEFWNTAQRIDEESCHALFQAIFPMEQNDKGWLNSRRPKAPKKNQFPLAKQNAERIELGEACIGFDKKRRVIHWSTGENNHAVERAHSHAVAKAFFNLLSRVVWTRGTGGELVGNDEYNIDAGKDYAGGGGSYVTQRFGAAEKNFAKSFGRIR